MLNSSEVLGVHIGGQLEVFEGVEGDVSVVHHSKDHRDVSALEGQQLDSSQVRHRAVETGNREGNKSWDTAQRVLSKLKATICNITLVVLKRSHIKDPYTDTN